MLICPICHLSLNFTNKTYQCANQHSFDVAKDGYVNLHLVQHKKSKHPGDTPAAVQARRAFLSAEHYQPLKSAIVNMIGNIRPKTILDIGCGEGYYTQALGSICDHVIGLDIAKSAIQTAAKADGSNQITWVVATGSVLPIADKSINMCTSFFSPLPKDEIRRVLCDGGYLMVASAAPNHLYDMRAALFETVVAHHPNKSIQRLAPKFCLVDQAYITAPMHLDNTALKNLIAMTPYAYKAKSERRAVLECCESFFVQAEFCLFLFKKLQ